MSNAIKICQGRFGRVALLDMDAPLVAHAHHHCHVLMKAGGPDTFFSVRDAIHPLTADTAVLVNSWEPHAYCDHDVPGVRTVILALYIEPGWLAEIHHPLALARQAHVFPQSCVCVKAPTRKIADELVMELWWSDAIAAQRLEILLFDLMVSVIGPIPDWRELASLMRSANRRAPDPRVRRAIAYLREHIGADIDMDSVAAHCGLSRAHFFVLFRESTNVTPQVYANVLRMEAAIDALSHGGKAMTDISYDIGFSAPGHFTRFFRQHLGITPSEYRRVVNLYDGEAGKPVEI